MRVRRNQRASVLILILWVVMFLSMIALSLGRTSRMGYRWVDRHADELKARAMSMAGFMTAVENLRSADGPVNLFPMDVRYEDNEGGYEISCANEEQKINLNAANEHTRDVLKNAFAIVLNDDAKARVLARSVLQLVSDGHVFESIEELSLQTELSSGDYQRIRDAFTVFPKAAVDLKVNLQTAPPAVLQALARSLTEETATGLEEADDLVDRLMDVRVKDQSMDWSQMDLNHQERILAERLTRYQLKESHYVRIRSRGYFKKTEVVFEAVVYRPHLAVVDWRRVI